MSDYEEDMRIIGAASSDCKEEWHINHSEDGVLDNIGGTVCTCEFKPDAEYIAHFNPSYTKLIVKKAMDRDALAERVEELEGKLRRILTDYYNDTSGMDDDEIEKLVEEELLK